MPFGYELRPTPRQALWQRAGQQTGAAVNQGLTMLAQHFLQRKMAQDQMQQEEQIQRQRDPSMAQVMAAAGPEPKLPERTVPFPWRPAVAKKDIYETDAELDMLARQKMDLFEQQEPPRGLPGLFGTGNLMAADTDPNIEAKKSIQAAGIDPLRAHSMWRLVLDILTNKASTPHAMLLLGANLDVDRPSRVNKLKQDVLLICRLKK